MVRFGSRAAWITLIAGTTAACASSAVAQVVPPVPPPAQATPAFTPPAPAAPQGGKDGAGQPAAAAPATPAEPEPPMITLVDRDENNKVRIIPGPAEEAAVLRLVESMTPEAAEKVRAGLEQRRKKVAETLAREAATALMIRGKLDELERTGDMKTLQTLGEQMRAVQTQPTLIKFLQAQSALQPRWAIRADKAAQDYVKAVNRDVREGLGEGNMQGLVIETMRTTLRNNTLEPMRELDRLLADGAGRWADLRPTLGLTPEQAAKAAAAEKDLSATDQRGRANAMAAVLGALTAEQQRTALAAVAGVDLSALPPPPAPAGSPGAPGGATKPADR